jgi:non-specific serine/threonine protein kinase
LIRIHRCPEQELETYDRIKGKTFGLKRGNRYGEFLLRANTHPYDFLTKSIPALTEAGFEIYGDKDTLGKLNKNTPSISLNITSGIDWFDLDVKIQYGDQEVKLKEVRQALKRGENFIKLADGSLGQIPDEWLDRYKHLFNMTKETEEGFRVRDYQLTLLDELLEDADSANIAAEFEEKRERLRNMQGIAKQPIPKAFTGELRPYQKAGLDWLHFLREYGFGGILADDMGLGKTIQMLAYLQSQRDQAEVTSAALLVVPKSLLTNWQRESANFTPNLRILEYIGNEREKDVSIFDEYDIIITTYGTMLRDIEILREYRFDTVILDESQAIKNPLAKTAKAARLLNGARRLAMTGTPVENNSFELWSQFAFLNPGLLGNLDYFKRDFAKAIESRDGEAEANLLKRMVYPFILRRTKEQVAPELPPRTERVIYTDFEPAQRKLYDATREKYRAQLLGVLDTGGMNDARMKILEGLLRLRQICIHPALVEPTYTKGVAKFEILMETLETLRAEGHKALIFSQFVQTLKLLEKEMKPAKMKYTYLDGKTRKRQERVDEFQNDPNISFFLISLKAGGVGLNLTAADYVIHLDPWWNPAVEMQATDRAHRIGQDKPVFVYKFIARDTVEEKILLLQERKKALVEQLISSESSFFKSLTRDDVDVLFS